MTSKSNEIYIKYIPLTTVKKWHWDRNPKQHDLDKIIQSIQENGFRDPPAYDGALNSGRGGIVEGNGRVEALSKMYELGMAPPKYIAVDEDSQWCVPILFGADSESAQFAERYGIDHNNLTITNFSPTEVARVWDGDLYKELLRSLQVKDSLPVSVSEIDLEGILNNAVVEVKEPKNSEGGADNKYIKFKFDHPDDRAIIEDALTQTGLSNRSEALLLICNNYLRRE